MASPPRRWIRAALIVVLAASTLGAGAIALPLGGQASAVTPATAPGRTSTADGAQSAGSKAGAQSARSQSAGRDGTARKTKTVKTPKAAARQARADKQAAGKLARLATKADKRADRLARAAMKAQRIADRKTAAASAATRVRQAERKARAAEKAERIAERKATKATRARSKATRTSSAAAKASIQATASGRRAVAAVDGKAGVNRVRSAISATPRIKATFVPAYPLDGGKGRRIVYDKALMTVWLIGADDKVVARYPVVGRWDRPAAGKYRVYSKSPSSYNSHSKVTFDYMTRFAWGTADRTMSIGFHSIPEHYDGTKVHSPQMLGLPIATGGCVRMSRDAAREVYEFAEVGTRVVVLASPK